jgi:hypothetical protein
MDGGADKIGTRVLQVIFWFGGELLQRVYSALVLILFTCQKYY